MLVFGWRRAGLSGWRSIRCFVGANILWRINFALATDASKIAFVHAVRYLQRLGVPMIDCQVYSQHLASLGAAEIAHEDFMAYLNNSTAALFPKR